MPLLRLQLTLACLLVAAATAVVLLWALLLALSLTQSGLMPWVAAGVVLYGWLLVVLASFAGVPGVIWASHLASRLPSTLSRVATFASRVGIGALTIGIVSALAVLVAEWARPRSPHDGCVIYRSEAASAALAASGIKPTNDCPSK